MSSDVRSQAIECMEEAITNGYPHEPSDAEQIYDALIDSGFVVLAPGELKRAGWLSNGERTQFLSLHKLGPQFDAVPVYVRTTAPEQGGQG